MKSAANLHVSFNDLLRRMNREVPITVTQLVQKLFFVYLANVLQSKRASKDNNFADLLNIKWTSNSSLFQTKIGKEDILQLQVFLAA